jgi:hypothetical protein
MKKITLLLIALMVFTFGQAQNLALSGTAIGSNENQPASNAIDGNTGTRWETDFSDPHWITVDLGMSYEIGQVVLNWEGAFGSSYEIQISDDATFATYTTIFSTTTGDGGIDDLTVNGTGRYVRMYGSVRGTPYGYSLWEFEIYEAIDPAIVATLSDLTVNGLTVDGFASSIFNYNVLLPIGTTVVPTVVATASQVAPASAVVTDATSLPGTTSVLVTAQNGIDTNTYTINFTAQIAPVNVTFDLTFEPGTAGSDAFMWDVFENGPAAPPLEVVANPNPSGVNTSATVAKFTSMAGESEWAGCANQHGTIWEWELDGTSTTLTIDVYKSVISDVMVKIVNTTNGTIYAVLQPNTVINQWETLTYDISGLGSHGENHNVDTIVVHSDIVLPRATDNISYFDNISWEGLKTKEAQTVLGVSDFETTKFTVYPNPTKNVWNINSNGQVLNSISVFDVSGKQVKSLKPNSNETVIDASNLNTGLYFVRLESNSGIETIKLIKN